MDKNNVKNNLKQYGRFILGLIFLFVAIILAFKIASALIKVILWVVVLMILAKLLSEFKIWYERRKREKKI